MLEKEREEGIGSKKSMALRSDQREERNSPLEKGDFVRVSE